MCELWYSPICTFNILEIYVGDTVLEFKFTYKLEYCEPLDPFSMIQAQFYSLFSVYFMVCLNT
jgi:hypothetical protein